MREVKCAYCGKKYVVSGTSQKYCSPKCRKGQDNRNKRNNARTLATTCIICGCEFMTSPNTKAKTCGRDCLLKYRSELTAESYKAQKTQGGMNVWNEYIMPCPWESGYMTDLPPGVTAWSDPQMDPMSGGFPMVTFNAPVAQGVRYE